MLKFSRYFLLAFFGLAAGCAINSTNEISPLKVFVMAGQSNMVGSGVIDDLPPELSSKQNGNLVFANNEWIDLEPGVYQERGVGPELSFALRMSQRLGEPVGIIKYSAGRTNLAEHWAADDPDSLYAELAEIVKAAASQKNIEVVGMGWMQGESDTHDLWMAESYRANLTQLVTTARRDFGNTNMFFVAGRINTMQFEYVETVREALMENHIENYAYVNCDDLTKVADNIHYDTAGLILLGERMADEMPL